MKRSVNQHRPIIERQIQTSNVLDSAEVASVQAILFKADGPPEALKATADALGLEPRDVNLFVPHPQGLSNQRASLTPRGRSILFRTEVVRALVRATSVHLFPCK